MEKLRVQITLQISNSNCQHNYDNKADNLIQFRINIYEMV